MYRPGSPAWLAAHRDRPAVRRLRAAGTRHLQFRTERPHPRSRSGDGRKDHEYRLTAELPGLKEEDVEISIADGTLTLSGEKREEEERKDEGYLLSERRYGSFERRIALPADIDADAVSAEFRKGVLTITLPKDAKAAERTRKIAITAKS